MIELASFIHFGSLVGSMVLCIFGVVFGQAAIGRAVLEASNTQPQSQEVFNKIGIITLAFVETSCILALTAVIILFFNTTFTTQNAFNTSIAQCGCIFALGITGLMVGLATARPAIQALHAVARQPFFSGQIINLMIIAMSIMQSPIIFGFIIQIIIHKQITSVITLNSALKYLAASACLGLGSIGPIIGQGLFAQNSCRALGINRACYSRMRAFALLSQSMIETPIILALIMAVLIIITPEPSTLKVVALIGAALCVSLCNTGSGISSGRVSAEAATQMGINTNGAKTVEQTSFLAQGVLDSLVMYGFIIGILLIYS
jgi:F0F1-type ATP synthase membrane subunit c/vacuolar-type H+-ATPase subunit K